MLDKIYQNIKDEKDVRGDLILLKSEIKDEQSKKKLLKLLHSEGEVFMRLLKHEDPKVRKNAALILGRLKYNKSLEALYQAYVEDAQLYNKSAYLKAIEALDYDPLRQCLSDRLTYLLHEDIPEENKKHIREEIACLQKMLLRGRNIQKHSFQPGDGALTVILTTNPQYREVTARQIAAGDIFLLPMGIKTTTKNLKQIQEIRTYSELLFPIPLRSQIMEEPIQAAKVLAESDLLTFLEKVHHAKDVFYYRLGIVSPMSLNKRSTFIKKCAYELESRLERRIINTPSHYEVEIRLYQKKDKTFFPVLRLYTLEDKRFRYRKHSVAASLAPAAAALVFELAAPFLKDKAQVLDPFCGVGTMLIERDIKKETRVMYGIDYFHEAIVKAKENTALAGRQVYYINRDFFTFSHEYAFDEICTNMPEKGQGERKEQDEFYRQFFIKAIKLLKPDGIILMISKEQGIVKKHLRLNGLTLKKEYCLNEKECSYLFIIAQRRQAVL